MKSINFGITQNSNIRFARRAERGWWHGLRSVYETGHAGRWMIYSKAIVAMPAAKSKIPSTARDFIESETRNLPQ